MTNSKKAAPKWVGASVINCDKTGASDTLSRYERPFISQQPKVTFVGSTQRCCGAQHAGPGVRHAQARRADCVCAASAAEASRASHIVAATNCANDAARTATACQPGRSTRITATGQHDPEAQAQRAHCARSAGTPRGAVRATPQARGSVTPEGAAWKAPFRPVECKPRPDDSIK